MSEVMLEDSIKVSPQIEIKRSEPPKRLQQAIRIKNRQTFVSPNSQKKGSIFIRKISRLQHCQICENDFKPTHLAYIADCQHKDFFCQNCLNYYAIYAIEQFNKVRCPNNDCEQQMNMEGTFFKTLPISIQQKYRKIHTFYLTVQDPTIKMCSREGCSGSIKVEEEQMKIKCMQCSFEYCSLCFLAYHQGDCSAFQLQFFQGTLHYRKCPRCKENINRNQSSNHMKCACLYEFCYVCRGDWNHHHMRIHDENGQLPRVSMTRLPSEKFDVQLQDPPEDSSKKRWIYCLTLLLKIILAIIFYCLLIAAFSIVIFCTLFLIVFCTPRRKNSSIQSAWQRKDREKTNRCIDDMCSGYFDMYPKICLWVLKN